MSHWCRCSKIQLITIELPGGFKFTFAGSLHERLDCPRICPSEIPEFLQSLQNIIRSPPLSIVEYNKAVHRNAFGTKEQYMKCHELGFQSVNTAKCKFSAENIDCFEKFQHNVWGYSAVKSRNVSMTSISYLVEQAVNLLNFQKFCISRFHAAATKKYLKAE